MLKSIRQKLYLGSEILSDNVYKISSQLDREEILKTPKRTDVINYLIQTFHLKSYLEIGVRNPNDNFNRIVIDKKISVDPGIEFEENPVDYKLTSDEFFKKLNNLKIKLEDLPFEIIFIDGMHTASQVYKDIYNSLNYLAKDGFIVLHDCNPPTEYHAREDHNYRLSPAWNNWNGSVWKGFFKFRIDNIHSTYCIDSDFGIGIIRKDFKVAKDISNLININPFFEYSKFSLNRQLSLNLMSFNSFKECIK